MNKFSLSIISLFILGCQPPTKTENTVTDRKMEVFNVFNKDSHIQPEFDKKKFDTLHDWDFGWALLEPINIAKSSDEDKELSKRFSPGQKALYFFWYLDAEVTNGGFIQFYWNDYRKYLPTIKDGLKLIGDDELLKLVVKVDEEYLMNKSLFDSEKQKGNWELLYELKKFDEFDDTYYKIHFETMKRIEKYARSHPDDFVKLK